MKKIFALGFLFLVFASAGLAQVSRPAVPHLGRKVIAIPEVLGAITCSFLGQTYYNVAAVKYRKCTVVGAPGTWVDFGEGGAAIGSTVTGATEGSVLFAGASGALAQDNTNFFWDNSTKELRVDTGVNIVRIGQLNSPADNFGGISFGSALGAAGANLWGTTIATVLNVPAAGFIDFRVNGNTTYGKVNATTFTAFAVDAGRVPLTLELAGSQTAAALQITPSGGSAGDTLKITKDGYISKPTGNHWTLTMGATQRFGVDTFGYVYVPNNGFLALSDSTAETGAGSLATLSRAATAVTKLGDGNGNQGTFSSTATSPAQITANQNNYNPGSRSHFQRWNSDASRNVTGLVFASASVDGETHVIVNVGSSNIVLVHQSASSTDINRFLNSTGADITLSANQAADIVYDITTQRWRVFKKN